MSELDRCPTCGGLVIVETTGEGTSHYKAALLIDDDELIAELKRSRDAWRREAMRQHDRADEAEGWEP